LVLAMPAEGFACMVLRMTVASPNPRISPLSQNVTTLYGVGPERASQLARLEVRTIEDLLLLRPRRHEDRRHLRKINELVLQQPAITHGKVVALGVKWFRKRSKSIFELILDDGTARLHCRWWNLPYMEKYFTVGDEVLVFGKPLGLKPRTIDHPETEVLEGGEETFIHLNRITPIYPLTEGLAQRWLRSLIWRTLEKFEPQIAEPWPQLMGRASWHDERVVPNSYPNPPVVTAPVSPVTSFLPRGQAIHSLHFPEKEEEVEQARRRLALDEFVELQLQIQLRRKNFETKSQALPCGGNNHLMKPFLTRLGFKLTAAQTRVLRELRKDMSGPHPMRRLLQGDVGSGKTVVAACCALMALESGYNVALMAPTEILAEQHFQNFCSWLKPLGVSVELQTGSRREGDADRAGSDLGSKLPPSTTRRSTPVTLFVGTHALIHAGFTPQNIGLVIIDEQHKFGVAQREQLVRKGHYPHLLVMTATPIPRTLGLTLYGELDVSVIDELPPGRGTIRTFVRTADKLPKVWEFVQSQLAEGRQAYVVYSRVEDTGSQGDIKAVTKEFDSLRKALAPVRIGLLHGRLRPREKEEVMSAFRAKAVQVLLATSLIEVGVDVPNATVMLIENAEQFGLAQLHQLRGRVGRAAQNAYCILVASARSKEARKRLQVLEQTTDGFQIAEADLKLRGPGELLGQEQSGVPKFSFGDLTTDLELLHLARHLCQTFSCAERERVGAAG